MEQLCGLASIDLKKEETGLLQLSEKYKIPFVTYNADELMKIRSVSDSSDFVKKVTGVDNVCERAVRTYVPDGKLIFPKCRKEKMTVAIITHNGAIAPMADKVIHFKNGTAEKIEINDNPISIDEIEW